MINSYDVGLRNVSKTVDLDAIEGQTRLKYFKTKRRNQLASIQLKETLKDINKEAAEMLDKAYHKITNIARLKKERVQTSGHFPDSIPTDHSDDRRLLNNLRVRKRPWTPFAGNTIESWAKKGGKKFSMSRLNFKQKETEQIMSVKSSRAFKADVTEYDMQSETSEDQKPPNRVASAPLLPYPQISSETMVAKIDVATSAAQSEGKKSIKKLTFKGLNEEDEKGGMLKKERRPQMLIPEVTCTYKKPSLHVCKEAGIDLIASPPRTPRLSGNFLRRDMRRKVQMPEEKPLPTIDNNIFYMAICPPMTAAQLSNLIKKRRQKIRDTSRNESVGVRVEVTSAPHDDEENMFLLEDGKTKRRSTCRLDNLASLHSLYNYYTAKLKERSKRGGTAHKLSVFEKSKFPSASDWRVVSGLSKWRKRARRAAKYRAKNAMIKVPPPYVPRRSTSGSTIATLYNRDKAISNFDKLKAARVKGRQFRSRYLYVVPQDRYKMENMFMMKRFMMLQRHIEDDSYRHMVEREMKGVLASSVMSKFARTKALEALKEKNSVSKKTNTKRKNETNIQSRVDEFVSRITDLVKTMSLKGPVRRPTITSLASQNEISHVRGGWIQVRGESPRKLAW